MKKVFYISDLDGTLLNSQGVLSSYSRKALEVFDANKVPFSIATGRSYGSMRHVVDHTLNVNLPVITFDGALISSFHAPDPIYLKEIDSYACQDLLCFIQKEGYNVFLDILGKGKTEFLFENYQNEASKLFIESWKGHQIFANVRQVPLIYPYSKKTVISLAVVDSHERITVFKEKIAKAFIDAPVRFDHDRSVQSVDILWILPERAHKEIAIREFCSIKNIDMKDITFFGDNTNDLGVFSIPEVRKVAVANAIEPIRELADIILEENDKDSVIRFIEEEQRKGLVDL